MDIHTIDKPLILDIHGCSGLALNKDYADTAFKLMNRMWHAVKANNLANKGLNVWVYESGERVFAGVELIDSPGPVVGLEHKRITLSKYASYRHVGPYHQLKQAGLAMRHELESKNILIVSPYIEIYGHWSNDESKLETELIMAVEY